MFSNKTAWFSQSCVAYASNLWTQNGGRIENSDLAQFIFSDNWEHKDTIRFSTSQAYLKQHLAVFRSSYVSDAVKDGPQAVSLGTYLLIPKHIQKRLASGVTDETDSVNGDMIVEETSDEETRSHTGEATPQGIGKRNRKTQNQHSSSLLPHTSASEAGRIGMKSINQTNAQGTPTRNRSLGDPDSNTRQMSCRNSGLLKAGDFSARQTWQTSSRSRQKGSSPGHKDSVPSSEERSSPIQQKQLHDSRHVADIVHIDDLPKVTGILRTVNAKAPGVEMRYKS